MTKTPFLLLTILLITTSAWANDKIHEKGLVVTSHIMDPSIYQFEDGPDFPEEIMKKRGYTNKGYTSANYRLTFTRVEVYETASIQLIATFEEDLDKIVLESYVVPIGEDLHTSKGGIEFIGWKSHNIFTFKVPTNNYLEEVIVVIKALDNGNFEIEKTK